MGNAAPRSVVDDFLSLRERMHRTGTEFLKIDMETAMTFIGVARQTKDTARQRRNVQAARKAYDTIVRLMEKIKLKDSDARILEQGLARLRTELREFGEVF